MPELQVRGLRSLRVGPIDLTIEPGECVCVTGKSGTGKTLLLRAIADLDSHEGTVRLGNLERESTPAPDWRRRVGFLPAESQWWRERVGPHMGEGAERWLHALDFDSAVLGWEVHRLSSGERQRLALVRLLCNLPAALLLDEPTAALDAESSRRVEALIETYRSERAAPVLWVSHDPAQIGRVARRHYRIEDGRLEGGTV